MQKTIDSAGYFSIKPEKSIFFRIFAADFNLQIMANIIGRYWEKDCMNHYIESGKPEFVALFGRRRVGKTFFVREFFVRKFFFYFSGAESVEKEEQLANFNAALKKYSKREYPAVKSWFRAFDQLIDLLERTRKQGRLIAE